MSVHYSSKNIQLRKGNVLDELRAIKEVGGKVDCVITSPPYYGLRRYDGDQVAIWGGDDLCRHEFGDEQARPGNEYRNDKGKLAGDKKKMGVSLNTATGGSFCKLCSAWRGALGLEPTPALFVEHLVLVLRGVRDILNPEGLVWWNLGDSFAGRCKGSGGPSEKQTSNQGSRYEPLNYELSDGLKDGDLVGVPFMFFLAAQADGWWTRSTCLWHKNNVMPSSVDNRPTVDFEYVFMLAQYAPSPRFWTHRDKDGTHKQPEPDYRWIDRVSGVEVSDEPEGWKETTIDCPTCEGKGHLICEVQHDLFEVESDRVPCDDCEGEGKVKRWKRLNLWRSHDYYYDQEDVRRPHKEVSILRADRQNDEENKHATGDHLPTGKEQALNKPGKSNPLPAGGSNLRTTWSINVKGTKDSHFACVDDQTEALTPTGWKKHSDLKNGDIIAAYDAEEDGIIWSPATFYRYPFDGDLISIEKRDSSQRLTAHHQCLVRERCRGNSHRTKTVNAAALKSRMDVLMTADWCSAPTWSIGIDLAALVGWFATDSDRIRGKNQALVINQSASSNPHKTEQIRRLLVALNADFVEKYRSKIAQSNGRIETQVSFQIRGQVATRLRELCPGNMIPVNSHALPENEAAAMLDSAILGDGHKRKDGRASIIQKNKEAADRFQMLAIRCGYRAMIKHRKQSDGCFVVYLTRGKWLTLRKTNGVGISVGREHYAGTVWCPRVAPTFWLARRDGMPFITGNTFPDELVKAPILISTSRAGHCPKCHARWTRVVATGEPDTEHQQACGGDSDGKYSGEAVKDYAGANAQDASDVKRRILNSMKNRSTIGWRPTCECGVDPVPDIVLDPFCGSATTGKVALKYKCNFVGIDVAYQDIAMNKLGIEVKK